MKCYVKEMYQIIETEVRICVGWSKILIKEAEWNTILGITREIVNLFEENGLHIFSLRSIQTFVCGETPQEKSVLPCA